MKEVLQLERGQFSVGLNHDVEYKRVPDKVNQTMKKALYLQIIIPRPEDRSKKPELYPIIVFAAGGGWNTPQVRYSVPTLGKLAERGFVVAMADYRGTEHATGEEAVSDIRSAVRFMRKRGAAYGGNPENIFLLGGSAGAHISMLAGYHGEEFDDAADDLTVSADVSGVIELYGPADMTKVIRDTRERVQKGDLLADHMMASLVQLAKKTEAAEQDEAIKRFSVIPRISAEQTIPPTLIAQGDADLIVEAWNAEMLYEKLTEAKKEVAYYLLTGARHGDKRFFDTEMIDRYEAFIRKHCR